MATGNEINAVAAALLPVLRDDIHRFVPSMFQGMIPENEAAKLAQQLAPVAIAALDAERAKRTTS